MKSSLLWIFTATLLAAATGPRAQPQRPDMPMERPGMMGGGMMGGGMMQGGPGMIGMMQGCERMMSARGPMPQLPAGNEKLQLQMHAEMMQRMGEILAKYAAQVK